MTPTSNDVLCEKGLQAQRHPGNIHYHNIIEQHLSQYQNAQNRKEKDAIALSVFHSVPGRFLEKHEDGKYYIASQTEVVKKIKQAFRDRRRDPRTNPGQKQKHSSKIPVKSTTSKAQKKHRIVSKMNIKPVPTMNVNPIPINQKHSPIQVDKDMKKVLDICESLTPPEEGC